MIGLSELTKSIPGNLMYISASYSAVNKNDKVECYNLKLASPS